MERSKRNASGMAGDLKEWQATCLVVDHVVKSQRFQVRNRCPPTIIRVVNAGLAAFQTEQLA